MLPKDPSTLLSYVNMLLRDKYSSFDALLDDLGDDASGIADRLGTAGYLYNPASNAFVFVEPAASDNSVNTVWSDKIQGIHTLYDSRALRFSDVFMQQYVPAFSLPENARILEIGCGPGALCEALMRWYPSSSITGIDRDSNFIAFAKAKVPGVTFLEGDATKLPFDDESFDVTISNTVAEHIEPTAFYGEQLRVLKKGGICLVLSARKGIHRFAESVMSKSEREKELSSRSDDLFNRNMSEFNICAYPQTEAELPSCMGRYGFKNISTSYAVINLTPDSSRYSRDMAVAMINSNRSNDLDNVEIMEKAVPPVITKDEAHELRTLINKRFDRRIMQYDLSEKQWDVNLSITMIVRGVR